MPFRVYKCVHDLMGHYLVDCDGDSSGLCRRVQTVKPHGIVPIPDAGDVPRAEMVFLKESPVCLTDNVFGCPFALLEASYIY
ncbi:hypothetical protein GDO78_019099 [Eleutherodactylus coqui]|uniref:Uncharacterized protein n=1 Tax=Eleutherodactylus coqui TaxID=57060 RepID=A0A8J6BJU2_ELECQ|nr:hypothetical protein GDO78_019099 [Eleutherodactylus coqui]